MMLNKSIIWRFSFDVKLYTISFFIVFLHFLQTYEWTTLTEIEKNFTFSHWYMLFYHYIHQLKYHCAETEPNLPS